MSIDLDLDLVHPVHLRPLLPKARAVLTEILGASSIPELTLQAQEKGERVEVVNDELRDLESPLFLVSIAGEPETIGLLASTHVTVTMAAWRSNLEYALGAAFAIALARELDVAAIEDGRRFFSDEVEISPDDLLKRLKVAGTYNDYQEAAEQLSDKLDRETRSP